MTAAPPRRASLNSPLKTHGGKHYMARHLIPLFPPHSAYVQPYCGGLNPLVKMRPATREVASDLNPDVVNFWTVLRDRPDFPAFANWPYTREVFEVAPAWLAMPDPMARALGFLVRSRFSRGGKRDGFAWSNRERGGRPGDENAWRNALANLPRVAARVARVEFRREPALATIREFDSPEALFYLDPPYHPDARTDRDAYGEFEMTPEQHAEMLDAANACRGSVVVSGYRVPLYDAALKGWEYREFAMPNHSGQGKSKQPRIESVWIRRARDPGRVHVPMAADPEPSPPQEPESTQEVP